MGRSVGVSRRKKKARLPNENFSKKTGTRGRGGGTLRVTFSITVSIHQSSPPTWRRAPGTQGPAVPRHICGGMYAPRGASVPGASVPGRGRGGRLFSAAVPAPSLILLSPNAPPRGPEERRGEPHVPKKRSFGPGAPRQSHVAAEPPPQHRPRFSPHVLSPELRLRKRGSSHVGPAVSDYVPGDPPLQRKKKKKKSASVRRVAGRQGAARCASPGSSHARTRRPVPSGRGSSRPGVSRQP